MLPESGDRALFKKWVMTRIWQWECPICKGTLIPLASSFVHPCLSTTYAPMISGGALHPTTTTFRVTFDPSTVSKETRFL